MPFTYWHSRIEYNFLERLWAYLTVQNLFSKLSKVNYWLLYSSLRHCKISSSSLRNHKISSYFLRNYKISSSSLWNYKISSSSLRIYKIPCSSLRNYKISSSFLENYKIFSSFLQDFCRSLLFYVSNVRKIHNEKQKPFL